ncbi:MAG: hypothetical protein ACE5Q6_03665 [Dehalococcoidia bacterium]
MSLPRQDRGKQVVLQVFDNEPMARLAEQRLKQEDIPCLVRSLHGGPGLWGSAYNLPHALYIYESDQMQAREVLEMPPLELEERERQLDPSGRTGTTARGTWLLLLVIAVVIGWILFQLVFLRNPPPVS